MDTNKYFDFETLFKDLYQEQEDALNEHQYEADHYKRLIHFNNDEKPEYKLELSECDYNYRHVTFIFIKKEEFIVDGNTPSYTIIFDRTLDEFTACDYDEN